MRHEIVQVLWNLSNHWNANDTGGESGSDGGTGGDDDIYVDTEDDMGFGALFSDYFSTKSRGWSEKNVEIYSSGYDLAAACYRVTVKATNMLVWPPLPVTTSATE